MSTTLITISTPMPNKFSDERLQKMTRLVGAFISAVRKTGKAPAITSLYKDVIEKGCDAAFARKFRLVMEQTVAHIDGKSARLYRDNRTIEELMPFVEESWFNTHVPEARKQNPRKPKNMAEIKIDLTPVPEEPLDDPIPVKKAPTIWEATLDELVNAIERKGWEVTLKHIRK